MIFLTADMVAAETGFAGANSFLAARDRLETNHDFPPPMPTCRRPLKWRADEVRAWVARQGIATPPVLPPLPAGGNVVLLREAQTA